MRTGGEARVMARPKVDATLPGLTDETIAAATTAEELGFDGVWTPETDHDAFLAHPVMAEHTTDIELGTRIALSFTRSPMVLAYTAWDLQRYSNGRFILGLGTQVKGHNERRFSVDWEAPGPRLREVVESLRHIWDVFQGRVDRLDYSGDHYSFSLMTDFFNPGPIDHPDIPIYIAGINEYNLRLAGELCDGLAMHGFNTPAYTEDVILPAVAAGAERAGRSLEDVTISASPFVITGDRAERDREREEIRRRIAFYGSTRTYHDVLEHHGWKDIGMDLHELSREGKWEEMSGLVTDEMVDTFAVESPPSNLLDELTRVYGDVADRIMAPLEYGDEIL